MKRIWLPIVVCLLASCATKKVAAPRKATLTPHSVTLNWQPGPAVPGATVTGFKPYKATAASGPFGALTTVAAAVTTYVDTAVSAGLSYWYNVTAVGTGTDSTGTVQPGESVPSNTVTAVIPADPLPGSDTLTLNLSEDAYNGNAQFSATIDGIILTSNSTVTVLHSSGNTQAFIYTGSWGTSAAHKIVVKFLNDAWGGNASLDRNLYAASISYDGVITATSTPVRCYNGIMGGMYCTGDTATFMTAAIVVPAVSVVIAPVSASVLVGATQQFSSTVTNSSNTTVIWSATCGSVSTSGLFTAPMTAGPCTVKATSMADSTKSASAVVTVTLPPLSITCDPNAITGMQIGDAYTISVSSIGRTASTSCIK